MTYNERRLEMIRLQNELAKEKRKFKNQSIKEQVLFAFVASFIIVLSIYVLNLQFNKAVDKCSQKHDIEYCIRKLR